MKKFGNYKIFDLRLTSIRHKNPTYFVGFLLCSETGILHDTVHRAACGVNPGSPKCPQVKKRKRRTVFV